MSSSGIAIPVFAIDMNKGTQGVPFSSSDYQNFFTYISFPSITHSGNVLCMSVQVDTGSTGLALPRLLVEQLGGIRLADTTYHYHPSGDTVSGSLYYVPAGSIHIGIDFSDNQVTPLPVSIIPGLPKYSATSGDNYTCSMGDLIVVGADSPGIHMMGIGFGRPLTGCTVSGKAANSHDRTSQTYHWTSPLLGLSEKSTTGQGTALNPGYLLTNGQTIAGTTDRYPFLTVGVEGSDITGMFTSCQSQALSAYTPYASNMTTATLDITLPTPPKNDYAYQSATPQGWIGFAQSGSTSPVMTIDVLLDTGINSMIMNLSDPAFCGSTSLLNGTTTTIYPPATLAAGTTSPTSSNFSYQLSCTVQDSAAASVTCPTGGTASTTPSSVDLMVPAIPATLPALPSSTGNIGSVNIGINPLTLFAYGFDAGTNPSKPGTIYYAYYPT